jgi:diadenosine tetraphosphate (Ap4A) HIT family hydrolase
MCTRWQDQPQLRIAEFEHCYAMLNADQFFPGYTLLFTKSHVTELYHLQPDVRQAVMEEVSHMAAALADVYRPAKMNYELLGNMVPHMHWHLVPRQTTDPLWPRPVWSEPHAEQPLSAEQLAGVIRRIRIALGMTAGSEE